ncbi:MAG: cation transporter [Prevotella sp.]|nr:cation transporter [Prevotella sp.]
MAHHHHHEESHHAHHHHAHVGKLTSLNGIFVFSIVINLLFVAVEAIVGLLENSLSLLSDAGHNLSDVFSLVLVLIAFQLGKIHSNSQYTYGYRKSSVLISLLNAIILLVAVGAIIIESIHKFYAPVDVNGAAVSWTALVGIIINGATALLLMRGQKNDLNVRGAFLHMAADTLVSVGVVVAGLIISFTGWNIIDPIVSLIIAFVILVSTWQLLSDSLRLSLDGMPEGITMQQIEHVFEHSSHVKSVHHIHVWAISTTENALTAHIVVDDLQQAEATKHELKHALADIGIGHCTLETETEGNRCEEESCC